MITVSVDCCGSGDWFDVDVDDDNGLGSITLTRKEAEQVIAELRKALDEEADNG